MIKLIRKILARRLGVPFQVTVWYNYRAMLPKNELEGETFVECFDEDGKYIYPPEKGENVIYNIKGERYVYKIIGFNNDRRDKDWLYATDYINPIIEFMKKL